MNIPKTPENDKLFTEPSEPALVNTPTVYSVEAFDISDLLSLLLNLGYHEAVAQINTWMNDPTGEDARKVRFVRGAVTKSYSFTLLSMFEWAASPQGTAYWNNIYHSLIEWEQTQ